MVTQSRQAVEFWSPRQRKRPYTASGVAVPAEVEKKREEPRAVALEERDWRTVSRLAWYLLLVAKVVALSQMLYTYVGSEVEGGISERIESERNRSDQLTAAMVVC